MSWLHVDVSTGLTVLRSFHRRPEWKSRPFQYRFIKHNICFSWFERPILVIFVPTEVRQLRTTILEWAHSEHWAGLTILSMIGSMTPWHRVVWCLILWERKFLPIFRARKRLEPKILRFISISNSSISNLKLSFSSFSDSRQLCFSQEHPFNHSITFNLHSVYPATLWKTGLCALQALLTISVS